MRSYDFIFSNQLPQRLARRTAFLTAFLIYFFYVNLLPGRPQDMISSRTYLNSLQLMIYLPVSVFAVYVAVKFLIPRFIYTGRYFRLLQVLTGLIILYFILAWLTTILFARLTQKIPYHELPVSFRWFLPVRYGIGFPLTSTVLVCIIKLLKTYYLETKENEKLKREKINTELQLIKTRFQPQFLYNALQNLLFLIQNQSAESPSILLKLSDLLSYILYENEKQYVPLEKELEIVKSFLILKKTFYPDKIKIQFHQQAVTEHLSISPLLLLSVVEAFLENMDISGNQEITLKLNIKTIDKELHFQLEYKSYFNGEQVKHNPDMKLMNALKSFELLYAGRNNLNLYSENNSTLLMLALELNDHNFTSIKPFKSPVLV